MTYNFLHCPDNIFCFFNKIFYRNFSFRIMKYFISIVIIGILFFGCQKPPTYSNFPIITSVSLTPNVIRSLTDYDTDAQYLPDTVQVRIGFTDGNGAIGTTSGDVDAFLIDSRQTNSGKAAIDSFSLPYITPSGNVKAISGTISLTVFGVVGNNTTWDTMHYTVKIVDRYGNVSVPVQTPTIYVKDN